MSLCVICLAVSCEEDLTPLPSPGRVIKSFEVEGQIGSTSLDVYNRTVELMIPSDIDLTSVKPVIEISEGATISPASGQGINVATTNPYTYIVTAASGQQEPWNVTFKVANSDEALSDYGVYRINGISDNTSLSIEGDITWNEKYWDREKLDVVKKVGGTQDDKEGISDYLARIELEEGNSDAKYHKWHVILEDSYDGEKFYYVRNTFSGLYLTAPDSGYYEGISLFQAQKLDDDNKTSQLWSFNGFGENRYEIKNQISGSYLALDEDGAVCLAHEFNESCYWDVEQLPLESYRDVEVQNFFRRNDPSMGSVAYDQGNSIPLTWGPNAGKVLWITEDAWDGRLIVSPDALNGDHFFSYNNSIHVQPDKDNWNPEDSYNLINTNPIGNNKGQERQMCTVPEGLDWTWPSDGIELDDKVILFGAEGRNLEAVSNSIYILHQNAGNDWPVERITPENCNGAQSMVDEGDGYVYCYSSVYADAFGTISNVFVYRFKKDAVEEPWEVYTSTGWSTNNDDRVAIAESKGTTNIKKYGNKYVMLSMDQGFIVLDERNIYLSTSDSPTGPFSEKILVYSIEEWLYGKKAKYYTPILHPTHTNDKNELLLTYSLNFGTAGEEQQPHHYINDAGQKCMHAYYYRLKAVRVPLSLIGL